MYTAATEARVAAEKAENDAADKLDEALRAIEESGAGSSGVEKGE